MNRRNLLAHALTLVTAAPISGYAQRSSVQERPDPATFQSGDFLWPKPVGGAFIPYSGTPQTNWIVDAAELSEEEWTSQKFEFIKAARASRNESGPDAQYLRDLADRLEVLSYTKFFNAYTGDVMPEEFQAYGAGHLLYVGHMAIVEIDPKDRKPHVVEAVYGKTPVGSSVVQKLPYDTWLAYRNNPLVWHGRLRDVDAGRRAGIATVASDQVNKPYRFFNFHLQDATGFYCSKLAWYATKTATGLALDGNDNPRRLIWFSPLQAMKQKARVELLSSAGNYRNA